MKRILIMAVGIIMAAVSVNAQSQSSNTVNFQGVVPPAAPTIGVLTPTSGFVGAAATIAFTGTNLASNCTATFGGAAVPFTFISATSGSIAVPAGKVVAGNNPIIVSCPLPVLTMNAPVQLPNAPSGTNLAALTNLQKNGHPCLTCSFSLTSGPTWLSLSASGNVTGTPSGAGSASFTFTVTDSAPLSVAIRTARITFS